MMATKGNLDPAARRRGITDPVSTPELTGLGLSDLRAYRQRLGEEEDRVSYWRRLVHARLDVLEAGARTDGALSLEDLVRVLGDTGSGRAREVLLTIAPAEPLPELPVLDEMWTEIDPHDEEAFAEASERLRAAERQLSEYRRSLHQCIDDATSELMVRYREDPVLALSALPEV